MHDVALSRSALLPIAKGRPTTKSCIAKNRPSFSPMSMESLRSFVRRMRNCDSGCPPLERCAIHTARKLVAIDVAAFPPMCVWLLHPVPT